MQFDAGLVRVAAHDAIAWIRADPRKFAFAYSILIVTGVGYDVTTTLYPDAVIAANFVFMATNLVIQAWTTLAILRLAGADTPPSARLRVASVFGVGLIYGLGVGLGLLLLILPGIYVAARWFVAVPILLAEDVSASEALSASWDRTEQYWLSCAILAVGAFIVQLLPAAGVTLASGNVGARWAIVVVMNAVSQAGWLFGVAAATTSYLAFARQLPQATEIFG